MEFKRSESDAAIELTFDQFVELVRSGAVPPGAWYRTPWGGNEWRTVDNYPPFHKHSPVPYPPGALLLQERERTARQEDRDQTRRRESLSIRTAIQASYSLRPLAERCAEPGACGASRLIVSPSFQPERVVTAVFTANGIGVEVVGPRRSFWDYVPHEALRTNAAGSSETVEVPGRTSAAEELLRGSGIVRYDENLGIMESWDFFVRFASPLEPCETGTLDGVHYVHEICGADVAGSVLWSNPRGPQFGGQIVVVRAYMELVRAAKLGHLLRLADHC